MSRGKPKRKLRSLIREKPTPADRDHLHDAFEEAHPVTVAILGAVMVEQQLEDLIRSRFPKNDDATWSSMLEATGPLGSFSSKIMIGYALGLYDANMRANLNIVREIRNVFAHSNRAYAFDHELIVAEIKKIKVPESVGYKRELTKLRKVTRGGRHSYIGLCYALHSLLITKLIKSLKAKNKRLRAKSLSPLGLLLAGHRPLGDALKSNQLLSQAHQSGGPNLSTQEGLLAGLSNIFDPSLSLANLGKKK